MELFKEAQLIVYHIEKEKKQCPSDSLSAEGEKQQKIVISEAKIEADVINQHLVIPEVKIEAEADINQVNSEVCSVKRKFADTSLMNTSSFRDESSGYLETPADKFGKTMVFSLASPVESLPETLRAVLPHPNIPMDESGVVKFTGDTCSGAVKPTGSKTITKTTTKSRRSSGLKPPSPLKLDKKSPTKHAAKTRLKQPVIKQSLLKPPTSRLRPPVSAQTPGVTT